jgi:uncharacterized protein YcaQ
MSHLAPRPIVVPKSEATRIWIRAQRLSERAPFGDGPEATRAAVEHLGYLQIDTINVIERCHHHILWTRIPDYRREHLGQAQSVDKTIFEYRTHALSYIPTPDIRFFLRDMQRQRQFPRPWFRSVKKADLRKLLRLIRTDGAISIRDVDDDEQVEKDHSWASKKPSKRVLEYAFYCGLLTISTRSGMLKTYELFDRHFGWQSRPKPATEGQIAEYMLARALRAQGLVSLDSICHHDAKRKPAVRRCIEARMRRGNLLPVMIEGEKMQHWAETKTFDTRSLPNEGLVHILSPFDPLIIQRKRLKLFFDYEHRFEAYVPKAKRVFGYFALPVLIGDEIVAVLDLKADRANDTLLIQQWTWIGNGSAAQHKAQIETELHRFERFQLAPPEPEGTSVHSVASR